jgi:outer membrane protein assembly factor BamE (lipoprotein component of BamABCDE complex)
LTRVFQRYFRSTSGGLASEIFAKATQWTPMRRVWPLLLLPLLGGCAIFSSKPHFRGVVVTPHEISQLTPGVSTEADVRAVLGSPTLHETFNNGSWLYISQVTKRRIGQTQGVLKQRVVTLQFNGSGVLQSIRNTGKKDAVNVAMSGAQTPVPGGRASFFQQLVGGVGHYNPGLGAGQPGGAGGGGGGLSGF